MNLRFSMLATALAASFAAGGAQAAMGLPNNTTAGNGSVVFLAMDVADGIALTIDLGLTMADFTNSTALTSGLTGPIIWDFSTNTTTAPTSGVNSWSAAYQQFRATQLDGNFQWAVVAGDQITGTTVSATNVIAGRGMLATGNATEAQMLAAATSAPTGNALGNLANWMAASNNFGNHQTVDNGAAVVTPADGFAWTNDLMGDRFGGHLTWSYLIANGQSSTFQWQQQLVANPIVHQFGNPSAIDTLSSAPITFTFDIATNQLVLAPIPEPGTYAMLLAGLGAMGFIARRRRQN